jgi:membrane associated rhomboid family serine protease
MLNIVQTLNSYKMHLETVFVYIVMFQLPLRYMKKLCYNKTQNTYQIITCGLVHRDIQHLSVNMFAYLFLRYSLKVPLSVQTQIFSFIVSHLSLKFMYDLSIPKYIEGPYLLGSSAYISFLYGYTICLGNYNDPYLIFKTLVYFGFMISMYEEYQKVITGVRTCRFVHETMFAMGYLFGLCL